MKVEFPANAIMVITKVMPIVMFDMLSNPWDLDSTKIFKFDEYT